MSKRQGVLAKSYFDLSTIEKINNSFVFFSKLKDKFSSTNELNGRGRVLVTLENHVFNNSQVDPKNYIFFNNINLSKKVRSIW